MDPGTDGLMGEIEVKKIGRQRWVISNWTWVKYFGPQKHQTTEEEHDVTTTIFDPTWRVKRVSLKHSTCAICASVDCHDCSFLSTVHDVGAQGGDFPFFHGSEPE